MPSSFNIGPLTIHFYGILIMIGALGAAFVAARQAKRRGFSSEVVWDMFPWLIIGGIIGARLWHILTPPASMVEQGITTWYYLTHPLDALSIWKGGLGIPGAVIGGAIALWIYTSKRKMSFGMWADFAAPGLALAQAVGRLGNYVNQEVYGAPTDLPWAITIDRAHRLPGFIEQATYHPLFAYELIYNLINMAVLLWISRRFAGRLRDGDIFLTYLVIYPVGRFFLEFLRLDPSPVAGVNINQTIMAIIAVAAAAALILRKRKPVTPAVSAAEPSNQ
ncbi:MAG TPA: prolipoprotein diacylglyceryl transferase [Bellilinea sp.]|nr:prolipoprotein diacylglyceryl transferase [Bellilinea sp.]